MSGGTGGDGVSPVPREARPWQGRRAGVVTRLAAAALDAAVVGLVLLAGYFGLAAVMFMVDPRGFELPHAGLFLSLTSAFVVAFCYLALAWSVSGRSYGGLVLGLRVQRHDGRPLGLVLAVLRSAACVVLPVGLLWVAISRHRCSLQDLLLGTRVVYDWQPRGVHRPNGDR
ncbi:RDD family protein [Nocardioides panaciterrulae]|uniref:Putative RDD family membrane protein YckC n=1 Tax=Nocardioides panaciterrulae TaxID=661492 RepID=A0A7Y9J9F3_9ACTN|nr:putative RDD family membrane protein YckC [Nocardioides panaciterrulae]